MGRPIVVRDDDLGRYAAALKRPRRAGDLLAPQGTLAGRADLLHAWLERGLVLAVRRPGV
jgi:hypothetical protein